MNTMLIGQRCTLTIGDKTETVTFLGYDAGDAWVQPVGTAKRKIVPVRALTKVVES